MHDIIWKIKKFFSWLKKSLEYAWFLRDDEDWDYAFIYALLDYKLKRTRECIVKNDFIEGTKRIEKQIKYAEYLIKIVKDGYVDEKARMEHEAKWGKLRFIKHTTLAGRGTVTSISFDKVTNPEELEQANSEMRKIHHFEVSKNEELKTRLYRHLKTYMHHWWD